MARHLHGLFAACVGLAAFLLFLLEPLQGRLLLPWFGGTPAVWNTCLVVFQILLLLGYGWAHWLTRQPSVRRQVAFQIIALAVPLFFLPISTDVISATPAALSSQPVLQLVKALLCASGPAFLAIATLSPLMQSWLARLSESSAKRSPTPVNPYALYAAGNAGSFLALAAYPALVEPSLGLRAQSHLWSLGYVLLLALFGVIGTFVWRRGGKLEASPIATVGEEEVDPEDESLEAWLAPSPHAVRERVPRLAWLVLSFIPASLLAGVTTYLTTDVASIPLLWVTPLALYLLSFVIVFARWSAAAQRFVDRLLPLAVTAAAFLVFVEYRRSLAVGVSVHLATFFVAALACHGRLALRRPVAMTRLTEFYLVMAVGGVFGTLFNTFLAPMLFSTLLEYPLALAAALAARPVAPRHGRRCAVLVFAPLLVATVFGGIWLALLQFHEQGFVDQAVDWISGIWTGVDRAALMGGAILALALTLLRRPHWHATALAVAAVAVVAFGMDQDVLVRTRGFYGQLTVKGQAGSGLHMLVHGGILHGEQYPFDPDRRRTAQSYYHPDGPLGNVIEVLKRERPSRSIAGIGLGVGTLAAYGDGDTDITFFEINPDVERIASNPRLFTYTDDCLKRWCSVDVVLGDGRLKIAESDATFDLIVVDAFNSDAIPVHLLTLESLKIYAEKLTAGGLIAYHISNRFVDLEPVLSGEAKALGFGSAVRSDDDDDATGKGASTWVILAAEPGLFEPTVVDERWRGLREESTVGVWTDDYANVLATFRWF